MTERDPTTMNHGRARIAGVMTRLALGLLMLLSLPAAGVRAQSADDKGLAVAREADRRDRGFGDSSASLRMVLVSRSGSERIRELHFRVLERPDGDRSLIVFDAPADVRGTALLTHANPTGDDDQWLYLPALKRVRRIAAANRTAPFMGSEFSYEDLGDQAIDKFVHRWLRDEPCPGSDHAALTCFVVERRPTTETSAYSRQIHWIDHQEYRTIQVDYFDRKGTLLKTLAASGYERRERRFWRAGLMLMTNRQTGERTRLIWTDYQFGVGLRESDFTSQALARAR